MLEREELSLRTPVSEQQLDRFRSGDLSSRDCLSDDQLQGLRDMFVGADADYEVNETLSSGRAQFRQIIGAGTEVQELTVRLDHSEGTTTYYVRVSDGGCVRQGADCVWKPGDVIEQAVISRDRVLDQMGLAIVCDDIYAQLDMPVAESIPFSVQEPALAELLQRNALSFADSSITLTEQELTELRQGCMRMICDRSQLLSFAIFIGAETVAPAEQIEPELEEIMYAVQNGFETLDGRQIDLLLRNFESRTILVSRVADAIADDDSPWHSYLWESIDRESPEADHHIPEFRGTLEMKLKKPAEEQTDQPDE